LSEDSNENLDYVFQALSNKVRREIIIVLGNEGPLTYSELMSKVGVEDSGTFGFHMRKMRRLLEKTSSGKYTLSELGKFAYNLLKGEKAFVTTSTISETKEVREPLIISDRISFELTEEIINSCKERGRKLIIADIVNLIIHKIPRKVFDEVVEKISDCVTVYVPKELEDIVHFKSKDVLMIKSYKDKPPRVKGFLGLPLSISSLISAVMSGVMPLFHSLPDIVAKGLKSVKLPKKLVVDEELRIKQGGILKVGISGGIVRVKEDERPWIKVWEIGDNIPHINIDVKNGITEIELERGECEILLPKGYLNETHIDMSGGITQLEISDLDTLKIDETGGMLRFSLNNSKPINLSVKLQGGIIECEIRAKFEEESEIHMNLEGGVAKMDVKLEENTRISADGKIEGGWGEIVLKGSKIQLPYEDVDYRESTSRLKLRLDVFGGFFNINIK